MQKHLLMTAIFSLSTSFVFGQTSDLPLVYDVENTGASCAKPPLPSVNRLPSVNMLPDPFAWSDGSGRCESFADWECRRNEIINEIGYYEIGVKPSKPADVTASYTGGTLTVTVKENGKTLTLTSKVTMPSGSGPHPVIIGMNSGTGSLSSSLFSDCIQIPFNHDQVATYSMSGNKSTNAPFYQMYPNLVSAGDYCAWSWGISRLIDGIFLLQKELKADVKHIGVTGCSYAGKMALFGGALDERVALTIAQESGGGGINSWRVSETIGNVEKISNTNYSWFMQSFKNNFNTKVDKIPYDHHELIGLIAPRAVLILGNPDYEWLGDPSGYCSTMAAIEIYKAMGIEDRIGFNFASGHSHCAASSSQNTSCQKYIDRFLRGKSVDTKLRENALKADYQKWSKEWAGTTLSVEAAKLSAKVTSPVNSSSFYNDENLQIETNVSAKEGVESVDLYLDGVKVATATDEPFNFVIENPEIGSHTIYIGVTDKKGESVLSPEVQIEVKERIVFTMVPNEELKIETEEMPTLDGPYVKPYTTQFDGMAYYGNGDLTEAFVNLYPVSGEFIVKLMGCADATTAANISLYVDGVKAATYTWKSNTPSELSEEIVVEGEKNPHIFQLKMETDNGKSDAFVDYLTIKSKKDYTSTPSNMVEAVGFYPNPASDVITLTGDVNKSEIIDVLGSKVLESTNRQINIKNLPTGMFQVKLYTPNGVVVKRLIKK